jgi:hypothetical protein
MASDMQKGTFAVKVGLAQMLKGGCIMDVVNVEQAGENVYVDECKPLPVRSGPRRRRDIVKQHARVRGGGGSTLTPGTYTRSR